MSGCNMYMYVLMNKITAGSDRLLPKHYLEDACTCKTRKST